MRLNKLSAFSQKKATVFMDEKSELQEDKEKAIVAIVHEIRNPLTAIKLTNQLMQEVFDKQERDQLQMQSYMMIISQNIGRIEDHLKEALTYRQRDTILEPVNVCDCLDKAVYLAQDRIYLGGITLNNNYTGDHLVYGQEEKLTTAFLNIIINAIEAIKTGKGKIWISVYETNNTVRITLKDNGCGMEPGIAERIFDPGFSTKDGIGIGLSNVKEIMKLHKAHIVADSLAGVGTSISILFNSIPAGEVKSGSKQISRSVSGDH
ncbi:MAG TPA: HAMP domain-containing sensor histidine kinase [Chitinophagaceae bacterium]|nr:HAMP domain-containing sensor histidine kinase [Chitinophagaceae bacterium]